MLFVDRLRDTHVCDPAGIGLSLVVLLSLTGCHAVDDLFCNGAGCEWTEEEWTRVQSLAAFCDRAATIPRGSAIRSGRAGLGAHLRAAAAGRQLERASSATPTRRTSARLEFYFDTRFSGNATLVDSIGRTVPYARAATGQPTGLACATCHDPAPRGQRLHLRAQHRLDRRRLVRRQRPADGERRVLRPAVLERPQRFAVVAGRRGQRERRLDERQPAEHVLDDRHEPDYADRYNQIFHGHAVADAVDEARAGRGDGR